MSSAQTAVASAQTISLPRAEYDALQAQVQALQTQLDWFKRQLFGVKSEKRLEIDPAQQADLLAMLGEDLPAPAKPEIENITYERRKSRADSTVTDTGLRFDDSVPVETLVLSSPELAYVPKDEQVLITEKITYRLAQRPGSYVVLRTIRPVIKHKGTGELITPAAPINVLDKSIADVSFLAGMLVDKFLYHLPLYRQHQRLRQCGIEIARPTLTNLSSRAINLLEPIFDAQFEHLLQSRVLAMDETPIKAGRKAKGRMRQGYLWPLYGEADEIVFTYTPSRAAGHVRDVLGESFSGTLVSDGYEAYARYARHNPLVTHAECWAHTRRYFERAKEADPTAADQALELIGALYRIEAHIRDKQLTGETKLKYRTEHSEPAVRAFWQWCDEQCQRHDLLPSHPLTKALKYAMARTDSLKVFLSDPDVPIDTNHLERALRPIPMGRKNWLFCWAERGAKQVGIIQSLLVTCKLHGINPHTYLVDVLQRISQHPASRVIELTPRVWKEKFADKPLCSALDRHAR